MSEELYLEARETLLLVGCDDAVLEWLDNLVAAARCAQADLIGSWQAFTQMDIHAHDWEAHVLSINEMADALGEDLPPELMNYQGEQQ